MSKHNTCAAYGHFRTVFRLQFNGLIKNKNNYNSLIIRTFSRICLLIWNQNTVECKQHLVVAIEIRYHFVNVTCHMISKTNM